MQSGTESASATASLFATTAANETQLTIRALEREVHIGGSGVTVADGFTIRAEDGVVQLATASSDAWYAIGDSFTWAVS